MAEFISTFITGFQDVVQKDLPLIVKGTKILSIYDGIVHYKFDGNSRELDNVPYFNNTFFVLSVTKGKNLSFPAMVNSLCNQKKFFLISKGSFRVRFSRENQFEKVDKGITRKVEDFVVNNSRLKVDRLNPSTEIWFCTRRKGFGFCGQLISKREFTEKNLNKGELRPEIAYLICRFADIKSTDKVADVFCGYGSIPVQLASHFNFETMIASDIDEEKINLVKNRKQLINKENIKVTVMDAFEMNQIEDKSINVFVTDPPWGFFEEIGDVSDFYRRMFAIMKSKITEDGRMIILSARKDEIEKTAGEMNVQIISSLHTLVNGKKASLYNMKFN